jgi:hypothetical protein
MKNDFFKKKAYDVDGSIASSTKKKYEAPKIKELLVTAMSHC